MSESSSAPVESTGGDDRMPECNDFALSVAHDAKVIGAGESPLALNDPYLSLLCETGKPVGQTFDNRLLESAQLAEIDRRCPESDTVRFHGARVLQHLGGVQIRF